MIQALFIYNTYLVTAFHITDFDTIIIVRIDIYLFIVDKKHVFKKCRYAVDNDNI